MSRNLTSSDRSALIKRASSLPAGSAERKAILAGLSKTGSPVDAAAARAVQAIAEKYATFLKGEAVLTRNGDQPYYWTIYNSPIYEVLYGDNDSGLVFYNGFGGEGYIQHSVKAYPDGTTLGISGATVAKCWAFEKEQYLKKDVLENAEGDHLRIIASYLFRTLPR